MPNLKEQKKGFKKVVKRTRISNKFCKICYKYSDVDINDCYGHLPGKDCPTLATFKCGNCDEKGHTSRHCTKEKIPKCRYCKEKGHILEDCDVLAAREKVKEEIHKAWLIKMRDLICSFCGTKGHTQKNCRSVPIYRRA